MKLKFWIGLLLRCKEYPFFFFSEEKKWTLFLTRRQVDVTTTIIIPVRDEADALEVLLPLVLDQVVGHSVELVVVDDGSVDGSGEVARSLGLLVLRQEGLGKPQAVRRGFEYATTRGSQATIVFDGDGQHPPELLPRMLSVMELAPLVKGTRFHSESPQEGTPPDRRELCHRVRDLVHHYTGWPVTDPQCGLIGLHPRWVRFALERLSWTIEWEIEFMLALKGVSLNGYPVHEVPIPARYQGLPGHKQVAKYDPAKAEARLAERLGRQLQAVHRAAERFGVYLAD